MPNDFTYEVSLAKHERVHPDPGVAMRFKEVGISNCPYGCKIYGDPLSAVRVLVHSPVYGCNK